MRIAVVCTPENPVPPKGYGGGERVADVMVRQLVGRGHEVWLFAAPGSTSPATRTIEAPGRKMGHELGFFSLLDDNENWRRFDVIVDRAAFHYCAQKFENAIGLMCGDPLKKYPHDNVRNRVYVSPEFAAFNECPDHPVLRNPVDNDPSARPLGDGSGGYALFVGPVHPIKGIHVAGIACEQLGMELRVYGPVRDRKYAEEWGHLWGHYGILEDDDLMGVPRADIFGNAAVFVHPTRVCDADPGAPKEAMLHGTPVVASARGGIRSRVVLWKSGLFALDDSDHWVWAIKEAMQLDRQTVRDTILPMVDPVRYGDELEALCLRIKNGDRW
jgi:glycosyltransferase involved in cell wall biosynthesis